MSQCCFVYSRYPLVLLLQKRLLLAEKEFTFSSNVFLLLLFLFSATALSAFDFLYPAEALLFQSIRILSLCYSLNLKIKMNKLSLRVLCLFDGDFTFLVCMKAKCK